MYTLTDRSIYVFSILLCGSCSHAFHGLQINLVPQDIESDVSISILCFIHSCKCWLNILFARVTVLARDSMAYFVIIFGLWYQHWSMINNWSWHFVVLFYFLIIVCLASMSIVDVKNSFLVSMIQMWVNNIPCEFFRNVFSLLSQSYPVHNIHRSAFHIQWQERKSSNPTLIIPGWTHDDEYPWTHARWSRTYSALADPAWSAIRLTRWRDRICRLRADYTSPELHFFYGLGLWESFRIDELFTC